MDTPTIRIQFSPSTFEWFVDFSSPILDPQNNSALGFGDLWFNVAYRIMTWTAPKLHTKCILNILHVVVNNRFREEKLGPLSVMMSQFAMEKQTHPKWCLLHSASPRLGVICWPKVNLESWKKPSRNTRLWSTSCRSPKRRNHFPDICIMRRSRRSSRSTQRGLCLQCYTVLMPLEHGRQEA